MTQFYVKKHVLKLKLYVETNRTHIVTSEV